MSSRNGNPPPPRRRPWSITTRLTLLIGFSSFTLLLAGGLFLYWVLELNLDREDTQFLADKVFVLRAVIRDRLGDRAALDEETKLEGAARQFNRYYARVLTDDLRTLAETPGMDTLLPLRVFPEPVPPEVAPGQPTDFKSAERKTFSLVSARAHFGTNGQERLIQVALDVSNEETVLASYRTSLIMVLLAGLAISTLAGRTIARRGLAPLDEMTRAARGITAARLDARVGTEAWPAELIALAAAFDEMLGRLEDSFRRLGQFSADIAHELRTPITNFLTATQVTLAQPRSIEDYRHVLESGIEEFNRLARMIETLLFLARAENGQRQIDKTPLDGRKEVETLIEFHRADAEENGVALHCQGNALVCANAVLFQRALSNLLSNAVRHTPPGGSVQVTLSQASDGASDVAVTDTGTGIAPEHLPHLFDRFYRPDPSRTNQTGGFGLGLALVKSIATLHTGEALISSQLGAGTTVTLRFPQAANIPPS